MIRRAPLPALLALCCQAACGGSSASAGGFSIEARDVHAIVARIAAQKGKPVLVNFWGTWCLPCVAELPDLLTGTRAFRERGGVVLTVAMEQYAFGELTDEQAVGKSKQKALELGLDVPVLVCTTTDMNVIRKALGVELGGLPQTLTWDRAGAFVHQHEGMATKDEFAAMATAAER